MNIYEEQTAAEKGRRNRKATFAISLESLAKQNQLEPGPTHLAQMLQRVKGSKGLVSEWLGAISRLTAQLNKGKKTV